MNTNTSLDNQTPRHRGFSLYKKRQTTENKGIKVSICAQTAIKNRANDSCSAAGKEVEMPPASYFSPIKPSKPETTCVDNGDIPPASHSSPARPEEPEGTICIDGPILYEDVIQSENGPSASQLPALKYRANPQNTEESNSPAVSLGLVQEDAYLSMPSLKTIQLSKTLLRDKEAVEKEALTPRSQKISDECHISAKKSTLSRKEAQAILTKINSEAKEWIQEGKEGWEHRKLALQYLYTQFSMFCANMPAEQVHVPQPIYALTHEILKRENNFKEVGCNVSNGSCGTISTFEIGSIKLAVKTALSKQESSLRNEIKIYASLSEKQQHGVIPFFGEANDGKELILEYTPHQSWDKKYPVDKPVDMKVLKQDLQSFLSSLADFHAIEENGDQKIHVDLKPANILIDEKGVFKLCDLGGVLNALDNRDKEVYTTPRFFPIDTLKKGRDCQLSTKSDIWQLGLSLYHLVSRSDLFIDTKWLLEKKVDRLIQYKLAEKLGFLPNEKEPQKKQESAQKDIHTAIDALSEDADWLKPVLKNSLCINPKERLSAEQLLALI